MFGPLLDGSKKAIYIYLDDEHKACNKRFADMLGYKSVDEWVKFEYPVSDVMESEQERIVEAYMDASKKFKSSEVIATWTSKTGKHIKTKVLMIPFSYSNEVFVLHFITPTK